MKVDNYQINYHCTSGTTILINGKDYREYSKKELIDILTDIIKENADSNLFVDILENLLSYLPSYGHEQYLEKCEDCGDYNESIFYEVIND